MRILAVDLGRVRTGLAVSDATELLASPLGTVVQRDERALAAHIVKTAREEQAGTIVVGHPRNMDGSRGDSAKRAAAFAAQLEKLSGLPVVLWDERLTTVSATGILNQANVRGSKRKQVVDTVAATVILQEYLDARRIQGAAPTPK